MASEFLTIELLQKMQTMKMNGNNNMITAYLKLQEKKKQRKRKPDQLRFEIERNDEKKRRQKHNNQKITRNKNDPSKRRKKTDQKIHSHFFAINFFIVWFLTPFFLFFVAQTDIAL